MLVGPHFQSGLCELARQPLLRLEAGGCPGDAPPPLRAGVALLPRDGGQFLDVAFEMLAVDRRVLLRGGRHGPRQLGFGGQLRQLPFARCL
jgi:hypothetical protein